MPLESIVMCLAAALSRAPGLGPTSLALPGRKDIKKAAKHTLLYKHIVHAHAVPPPTRTHEASYIQYKVTQNKKEKKKPGETSLALRCVGHAQTVLFC